MSCATSCFVGYRSTTPKRNRVWPRPKCASKTARAKRREVLPLATLLLPTVVKVRHLHAKAERRQDVLLIVEALRLYAGAHDGKLPAKIDDLQAATPTKTIDCISGKPWDYKLAGDTATLTLADERGSGDVDTLVYEITLAKPAK